jgi:hypothetical protein
MPLCSRCDALGEAIGQKEEDGFILHATFADLKSASDGGCHLCRIVFCDADAKLDESQQSRCAVCVTRYNDAALKVVFPTVPVPVDWSRRNTGKNPDGPGTFLRLEEWDISGACLNRRWYQC